MRQKLLPHHPLRHEHTHDARPFSGCAVKRPAFITLSSSTPMTDTSIARYCVIGHPIAHSRSPWIHARFAEHTGQSIRYEAIDSPPDAFAATLQRLKKAGYAGCNVTVPFKHEAFAAAQSHTPRATLAQAANTLVWQRVPGKRSLVLHADNTDGPGIVRDIVFNAGFVFGRLHLLLLGAGGAAAGVLNALIAICPASVTVANRNLDKARTLIERHYDWANMHSVALHACTLDEALLGSTADGPATFDLVINATSSSLQNEPLTFPAEKISANGMLYDMMYGAAAQPFLQSIDRTKRPDIKVRDGLGMLVEQAALSFSVWRDVRPRTAQILAELRALVDAETPPAA